MWRFGLILLSEPTLSPKVQREKITHRFLRLFKGLQYCWSHKIVCLWLYVELWSYLLSEPTLSPKVQREKITQTFSKTFQSPAIQLVSQASLSLAVCGALVLSYSQNQLSLPRFSVKRSRKRFMRLFKALRFCWSHKQVWLCMASILRVY